MKIQLALEKVMWVIVACLFIAAFPFCYWAATPDELVIISEPAETEEKETVETTKARVVTLSEPYKETVTEPIETASETEATTAEVIDIDELTAMYEDGYTFLGTFRCSAYCICYDCCGKTPDHPKYGITATGTVATQGRTIAVDPNVIPFGSEVQINGHTYIAEDSGSAIYGKRIDICFTSHQEAKVFGIQYLDVYLCN